MADTVFILGAGAPFKGSSPDALNVLPNHRLVLELQLELIRSSISPPYDLIYLAGYKSEAIVSAFPELQIVEVSSWKGSNNIATFFQCPLPEGDSLFLYGDVLATADVIRSVWESESPVCFAVDGSGTRADLEGRDVHEKFIPLVSEDPLEFCGILKLRESALRSIWPALDLSDHESKLGLVAQTWVDRRMGGYEIVDAADRWAEIWNKSSLEKFIFSSKSRALDFARKFTSGAAIGGQVSFYYGEWVSQKSQILETIQTKFHHKSLIVRSSFSSEDNLVSSGAGKYLSVVCEKNTSLAELGSAIDKVFGSFPDTEAKSGEIVFIQEFIEGVVCAGVIFTCSLETGAPYYQVSIEEGSGSTNVVTSGVSGQVSHYTILRNCAEDYARHNVLLGRLLAYSGNVEKQFGSEKLDLEFAFTPDDALHVFQVRPIAISHKPIAALKLERMIEGAIGKYTSLANSSSCCVKRIFGLMPDWNPAEMIGVLPRRLAFELYSYLITDETWYRQREAFGYCPPHVPLMHEFLGRPYIDVYSSFASFIPKNVAESNRSSIVNAYMEILDEDREQHDKIEFNIAFTCWYPGIDEDVYARLGSRGVSDETIEELVVGLKSITVRAITEGLRENPGLSIKSSPAERDGDWSFAMAFSILESCRDHSVLNFAHAARKGFIASTILRKALDAQIISAESYQRFHRSIRTVSSEMQLDLSSCALNKGVTKTQIVEKYGHLRPGTYDITQKPYWRDPEFFFKDSLLGDIIESQDYKFPPHENERLDKYFADFGLTGDYTNTILDFCTNSIRERERLKFEFTKEVSQALDIIQEVFQRENIDVDLVSWMALADIKSYHLGYLDSTALVARAESRQSRRELEAVIELPELLCSVSDFKYFERMPGVPNFIGNCRVRGQVIDLQLPFDEGDLEGKIVIITNADPGFEWLFSRGLLGLVTEFGGANSHMAIRCAELGISAAIGVGSLKYQSIKAKAYLDIDPVNKYIG